MWDGLILSVSFEADGDLIGNRWQVDQTKKAVLNVSDKDLVKVYECECSRSFIIH